MLARYQIVRGRRPPGDPLPDGTRVDTRKHTRHVLRPEPQMVEDLLVDASDETRWRRFADAYRELLRRRYAADPSPFESLAAAAREGAVHLGCSCPTRRQPNVEHCHTVLALRFMKRTFPELDVVLPNEAREA